MQDIPKLFTALSEWGGCLIFILNLRRRFRPAATVGILVGFGALLCLLQALIGTLADELWVPAMFAAMVLMFLCIFSCCRIHPAQALLYWSVAFLGAEFIAAFEWQLYAWISGGLSDPDAVPQSAQLVGSDVFSNVFAICFYLVFFSLFYLMEHKLLPSGGEIPLTRSDLPAFLITVLAVFFLSNISYAFPNTLFSAEAARELFYIRTLVDFAGVLILVSQQNRLAENALRIELANTNMLMQKQFEQYEFAKSNREALNRTYHDLKHQINAIRAESNDERRETYLRQLESGIEMYDTEFKTGNNVLDTLLTGKSMLCVQKGIQFTCVADGSLLDFMNTMDLCAVFGNALDNAIESAEKVKNPEKRLIRTAVYAQEGFTVIRFENYYEQEPDMAQSGDTFLPRTTKKDKELHGYGVKSIRRIAEKYGGTMTVTAQERWFYLRILIPEKA